MEPDYAHFDPSMIRVCVEFALNDDDTPELEHIAYLCHCEPEVYFAVTESMSPITYLEYRSYLSQLIRKFEAAGSKWSFSDIIPMNEDEFNWTRLKVTDDIEKRRSAHVASDQQQMSYPRPSKRPRREIPDIGMPQPELVQKHGRLLRPQPQQLLVGDTIKTGEVPIGIVKDDPRPERLVVATIEEHGLIAVYPLDLTGNYANIRVTSEYRDHWETRVARITRKMEDVHEWVQVADMVKCKDIDELIGSVFRKALQISDVTYELQ